MSESLLTYFFIGLGGGLGALARVYLAILLQPISQIIPWNYFWINITGSLAIGFLMTLSLEFDRISARSRNFLAVGFLGGYTTFSTYMVGVATLLHEHHITESYFYGLGSLIFGFIATYMGMIFARLMARSGKND